MSLNSIKTILITGGAGSIAKMFLRAVLTNETTHCIALDNDDTELYRLEQEMSEYKGKLTCVLEDMTEYETLNQLIHHFKPDFILHTAAHKQVSLLQQFPKRTFKINTEASLRLFNIAKELAIPVVFLSSDKSVEPSGLLGLSKWMAEIAFLNFGIRGCIIRLPNLWDSKGSFFTEFPMLIKTNGFIPLTDDESTRYLTSENELRDAFLELVERFKEFNNVVLIPKMATQRNVYEFLLELINEKGLDSERIKLTGLRAGEKRHEKLVWDNEIVDETQSVFFKTTKSTPNSWNGVDLSKCFAKNTLDEQIRCLEDEMFTFHRANS